MKNKLFICLLSLSFASLAAERSALVNVAVAKYQHLTPTTWRSGLVISPYDAEIAAEVSGKIIKLAEVGDQLKKGSALAKIDDELLQLQRKEQSANIDSAHYRLLFLKNDLTRVSVLAKQNLAAKNTLEQTRSERDIAQSDLRAAQARLAQTEKQLSYTQIKAPFNGVVVQRLSQIGEIVAVGAAIVRLVQTENLQVTANLPVSAFPFIKKGQILTVKSLLGEQQALVRTLVPVADKRSHLLELRLDLGTMNWPVGLAVEVAVPIGTSQKVLAVPRDALVLRRDGISVFRINRDNIAEQVSVTTGVGAGAFIEVKGDIVEHDQVVIRGAERLRPGQKVLIKDNNDALVTNSPRF